jgi:PAS domain S-box-containing protein
VTPRETLPRLDFRLPPDPARLHRARERIRDYLHQYCADCDGVDDVIVCLEEAWTNAISHSGSAQEIEVSLRFSGDDLVVRVKDSGRGFDIAAFEPDRQPDTMQTGGRGLYLMSRLTDDLRLRCDGGLEVRMAKRSMGARRSQSLVSEGVPFVAAPTHDALASDARICAMLEEVDHSFHSLDWEYRYVHVNGAALRAAGLSREEMLGRTPFELQPEAVGSAFEHHLREAMELGIPSTFEHRVASGNWYEVRLYPSSAGVALFGVEINERKRTEQDLVASRERLAEVLATISDGFYVLDSQWRITYLNDKAACYFRRAKAEALGRTLWELLPEAVGSEFDANKRKALASGQAVSFEAYYEPFDLWLEERLYPSPQGLTVLFSDITPRKRAELEREQLMAKEHRARERAERLAREYRRAEEALRRYELLASEARDIMLFVRHRDGRIVEANRAAEAAYGYTRGELLGLTIFELRGDLPVPSVQEQMAAAMRDGIVFEALHKRADGSTFPVEVSSRGISSFDGEPVLLSVIRDISERRHTRL